MAQGKTKGLQSKQTTSRAAHKASTTTKKGKRYVPPKKTSLVKQAAVQKTLTAKINKSIEEQMVAAASGGKLTIMKNASDAPSEKTK
ncbi:hypothetical protein HMN09_01250500 [Mycena chlorophos]|uniref:Uncharacterized protein n=1 Tax=Mycena chlorophos TaxID=658473 RepID=A0A8H6VXB1_MYCCL|nr:hypothetical protein HMN09_01250500 [Mycena chlorophos]